MRKYLWENPLFWFGTLGIFLLGWTLAFSFAPAKVGFEPYEHLGSKTPYSPPADSSLPDSSLANCEPIFINYLGRHGSRHLSNKMDDSLQNVVNEAQKKGQLISRGQSLPELLANAMALENPQNLGQLSSLGRMEQHGIATRLYRDYSTLLALKDRNLILTSTHIQRTKDSLQAFLEALQQKDPLISSRAQIFAKAEHSCDPTLRFFEGCQAFQKYKKSKPAHSMIDEAVFSNESQQTIEGMLGRLFSEELLKTLDKSSKISLARKLYRLCQLEADIGYSIAEPGFCSLFEEASEMEPFNLENDAQNFVQKGPGISADGISHQIACPLLKDFIDTTKNAIEKGNEAPSAIFRFAHSETIMPFLMQLGLFQNDSLEDLLSKPKSRQFRSSYIAPMSANLQWIVYRCPSQQYRVRMRHNEKDIAFPIKECGPASCSFETLRKFYEENGKTCSPEDWAQICEHLSCKHPQGYVPQT